MSQNGSVRRRARAIEAGNSSLWKRYAIHLVGAACLTTGCDSEAIPAVHLTVGGKPEERRSFQPKASLAEYTEIPGVGSELRVILSSRPITCESYATVEADQLLVVLNFTAPATLSIGSYPWMGSRTELQAPHTPETAEAPHEPSLAQVLPVVRMGRQLMELPPGGTVELTELKLDAQGTVRGVLRLEQPGSAGLPATALLGSFSAHWCRIVTTSGVESP
jgi:hypothetical protein